MRVLGFPFARFSQATAGLARQNAMRSPKRTARTSGALMVGVALVATITVVAASVKDWVRDIFDDSFVGDYVVSTSTMGFGGLSPEIADGISALPEVAALTAIRMGAARNLSTDDDTSYLTIDPTSAGKVFDVGITAGSVEALTPDGILIDDDPASKYGWSIGDRIDFRFLDGRTRALTVVGIYTADDLAGPYVIDQALHEQTGVDQFDVAVYIGLKAGTTDPAAMAAIQSVTDRYANAELRSRSEYIASQAQQLDPLVNLMYALLALAVVIALVNIANSMALSIHERTREIGLVRAVGMTRHQTRASIAWEAMLLGLFGTIGGLVIGVVFGWAVSVTIRDAGLGVFVLPIQPLAMIGAAAVAGGLLAAARPGRHAARINILDAIATV